MIHSGIFGTVIAMMYSSNSDMHHFIYIYAIYVHKYNDSNIRLFNIVVMVKSYYKFIYHYCLSFTDLTMIYLSVRLSESTICNIFQWIESYFNNLHDNFDGYKSGNHLKCIKWKCTLCGDEMYFNVCYKYCLCTNHCIYQQMTILNHLMKNIIVLFVCSILYYCNQTM